MIRKLGLVKSLKVVTLRIALLKVRNNTITCSVNNKTKLRLVTQNEEGDLYTRGGDKVEAQLIGSDGEVPVKILDNDDGTYQLLFTPNSAGEYQLFVKINSSEIMGSPFKSDCICNILSHKSISINYRSTFCPCFIHYCCFCPSQ